MEMSRSERSFLSVEAADGSACESPYTPNNPMLSNKSISNSSTKDSKKSEPANIQLQIINEHQEFNKELGTYMTDVWKLSESGFNYCMVAVFGSQSTGKSTLLNALFETQFDTMDDNYRQQTTKGLWASTAKNSNILVMDVEGVDGRERGEDQDFERKSALFSLAVSQVLLVNIWESQVGLYNGANIGLLKTVFEVNLQLFQQKNKTKTLLFFVIRDHIGKVPLSRLSETVKQDLQKAWSELSKPKDMESCDINDYFDFMFFGLPHKVLLPDQFTAKTLELRQLFYNPNHDDYVFRTQYHKKIPADGFPAYASNIWEQIVTNKDLDLPTQQQLLAQFRCDEISAKLFKQLQDDFTCREEVEAGVVVKNLGTMFRSLKTTAMEAFDIGAGRYNLEVYKKKRNELLFKIHDYLKLFYKSQIDSILQQVFTNFSQAVESGLKEPDYNFTVLTMKLEKDAKDSFTAFAQDLTLEDASWTYSKEQGQLAHDLAEFSRAKRQAELTKRENLLTEDVKDHLEDNIPPILASAETNMWDEVTREFLDCTNVASNKMKDHATTLGLDEDETNVHISNIRVKVWEALVRRLKDETADVLFLAKLRRRLEELFRYDADGLPRVWKPEDDIDYFFKQAKAEATELIPLYSKMRIEESKLNLATFFNGNTLDFDARRSLTLVSLSKRADIEARFKREADALFLEAKRSIVATTAKVPYWVMVLIFVLGWNEILYVLTSPLTLVFVVLGGASFYAVYVTNLIGPISRVIELVSRELLVLAQKAMEEAKNSGTEPRSSRDRTSRRERRSRSRKESDAWDERAETIVESSKDSSSSTSPRRSSQRKTSSAGEVSKRIRPQHKSRTQYVESMPGAADLS
ncbi:Dynamin-like GTPase that mediates homotypic ER fusion [Entomophthora muscae]|uniref:Dynamin-like GTPase that mediates homotypic ER fusion n=1 Tax=Entomophthora muscae TaxID=34485 RepID=A0ACC2T453_9FUNG|nr:Dynamin-like GTPase that mediates homotypic ER fusion [Entomophthora muscae]